MIRIYCGPMFSRKTFHLLRDLNDLENSGNKIKLIKPVIDTRISESVVRSRDGLQRECFVVDESKDNIYELLKSFNDYDVIGIDEAQFFSTDFIKMLINNMNKKGKTVILSGLDMDRFSEPFGSVPYIISVAEEVIKLKADCSDCKGKGIAVTEYMDSLNRDLICIGDKEYLALCDNCRVKRLKDIINANDLIILYHLGFLDTVMHNNELCKIVLFGEDSIICAIGNRLRCSIKTKEVKFYKEGLIFDIDKNFY